MQTVNFSIIRGDSFNQVVQFQDENDVPIDITSWSNLLAELQTIDGEDIATISVSVVNAATGLVRLTLANTITDDLIGAYIWDFERTDGSAEVKTMMGGYFNVKSDVTS